jgi:hypothetical protein
MAFSPVADLGADGLVLTNDTSPAEVIIDGGGREITLTTGTGSVITVGSGVTLTLRNITFKGLDNNNASLIKVDGGTLVLENGAVITGNTNPASGGGGVFVYSGTFSMKGGTISGNKSTKNEDYYGGGGVYVRSGTFEMSGGTISGNEALRAGGGGVYVSSGTFSMSGGTISNNKVNGDFKGGGVYVDEGGATFTMSGGTISDNEAKEGGGVYVNEYGAFSMSGGTISRNKAAEGGGVFVHEDGAFIKTPAGGSLTSGVIYGSDEDSLLANTAQSDSYGHAVKFAGGGNNLRNTTAGENVTLTTKMYAESGGWGK